MINAHNLYSRDGQPYNFEDGLSVKGFDLSGPDGTKAINVQLPGETQTITLYAWLLNALTQLNNAQQTLPFASNAEAIAGVVQNKLISPASLKAVLSQLIGNVPASLDSMAEFVTAINNDPNLSTTIQGLAAQKVSLAGSAMTGTVTAPTPPNATDKAKLVNVEYLLSAIDTALLTLKPIPTAPDLSGTTFGVIGTDYALNMSATAAPDMTIASFDVSINGAAPTNVAATANAGVFHWMVLGAEGGTVIFTVVAKDNRGRAGPSSTKTINVTAAAVNTPTVVLPADNSVDVSPAAAQITTSKLSMKVGTDTHTSTDWVITETSTGVVAYQSLGDTVNKTALTVPILMLKNATQYTVSFTYHSQSGYQSLPGVSHFVTKNAPSAVTITGGSNHAPGQNYTFTIDAPVPGTSTQVLKYYYAIGTPNTPVECTSSVTLTPDQLVINGGNFTVYAWAYFDVDGMTAQASKVVQELSVTPGAFLFPVNNAVGIPINPTFLVSAYSTNAAGDVHVSSTWTLTDLDTNQQTVLTQSTTNKVSWTPPANLFAGVRYRITCLQYGSAMADPVAVPAIEFVVTNSADVRLPTTVILSNNNAGANQAGTSVATTYTGGRVFFGSPGYDWSSPAVADVGGADVYNVGAATYTTFMVPQSTSVSHQAAMHVAMSPTGDFFAFDSLPLTSADPSSAAGFYIVTFGGFGNSFYAYDGADLTVQGSTPRPQCLAINPEAGEVVAGYTNGVVTWNGYSGTTQTQAVVDRTGIPADPLNLGMTIMGFAECVSVTNGQLIVSIRWGNATQSLTGFAYYTKTPGQWTNFGPNDWNFQFVKHSASPMPAWNMPADQPNAAWLSMSTAGDVIFLGRPFADAGGVQRGEVEVWKRQANPGVDFVMSQAVRDKRSDAVDNGYFGIIVKSSANGRVAAIASYDYQNGSGKARADLIMTDSPTSIDVYHQSLYSFIPSGTPGTSHNAMSMDLSGNGQALFIGNPSHISTVSGGAVYYYNLASLPGLAQRV